VILMGIRPACGSPTELAMPEFPGRRGVRGELPEGILADVVLDGFVRALDGFEAVLAGVSPGYWSAPSPCAGWSAADVAGHVIGDLRATEAMARGRYEDTGASDPGSAAGDDPLAAWRGLT
jgi:Mycothiol maleylpyruvate isomerase N-terminal domain